MRSRSREFARTSQRSRCRCLARHGIALNSAVVVVLAILIWNGAKVLGSAWDDVRQVRESDKILADARAVADAGGFLLVLEGVMEEIAAEATKAVACPTIGIGASVSCDGQVLVTEDMLGLFERVPRFVKRYDELAEGLAGAAATYADDVRARRFPEAGHTYQAR